MPVDVSRNNVKAAALIDLGLEQRVTARTAKNDVSSRSHTVLTVKVEYQDVEVSRGSSADQTSTAEWPALSTGRSKLVFVDLAGSERAGRPSSYGEGG